MNLDQLQIEGLWFNGRFVKGLSIALLLVVVNYTLEIRKWQELLNIKEKKFLFHTKAFLSGSAISLFMPFRSGEYLGRILYFQKRRWSRVIISSVRAGLLQLLVTLIVGMICSLFAWSILEELLRLNIYSALALGFLGVLLILLSIRLLPRWIRMIMKKMRLHISDRPDSIYFLRPFLLSVFRYVVFIAQYAALFWACGISEMPQVLLLIPVFLLVQTLVPTFFLSEMGLRLVLASYFFEHDMVFVPIALIYIINILLPALVGVFFIKRWKS